MTLVTRNRWTHPAQPPAGLRRVWCLGDSMMYGSGVSPRETLAAGLERELNETFAETLFETLNYGLQGGNIWTSWAAFRARIEQGEACNAVIFSLCNNDAELFADETIVYDPHKLQYWSPSAPQSPLLRRTFEDIGTFGRRHGLVIVILFYQLHDEPCSAIIEAFCHDFDIPFINIAQFLSSSIHLRRAALVCSPYDGHPSAAVHRLAARHVVQELKRRRCFSSAFLEAPGSDPVATVAGMLALGYGEARCFDWALSVLDVKERVARRRIADDTGGDGDTGRNSTARRQIERWLSAWSNAITLGAGLEKVRLLSAVFNENIETLSALVAIVEELAMALVTADDRDRAAYYWSLLRQRPVTETYHHYLQAPVDTSLSILRDVLARHDRDLRTLFVRGATPDPVSSDSRHDADDPVLRRFAGLIESPHRALAGQRAMVLDLLGRLGQMSRDLDLWWTGRPDREALEQASDWRFCLAMLCDRMANAVAVLDGFSKFYARPLDGSDGVYRSLFTRVNVVVMVETPDREISYGTQLVLTVDYLWPPALSAVEAHHMGFTNPRFVYTFEVPLLVLGTVTVEIKDHRATPDYLNHRNPSIARIELVNDRQRPDATASPSHDSVVYPIDRPGARKAVATHLLVK